MGRVDERENAAGAAYRDEFTVPQDVIDGNGHVNNVAYVQWMQDVAIRHFNASGCADAMRASGGIWVARSHHIEYLRPVFAGDRIRATTWIARFGRVRSLRQYEFVRLSDGVLVARGETDWVLVDGDTGRPRSIPDEVKAAFSSDAQQEPADIAGDIAGGSAGGSATDSAVLG